MLFTRCPSCDTTFRVTDEALAKASGQVRCGRCASVFNAQIELRETAVHDGGAAADGAPPHVSPLQPIDAPRATTLHADDGYDNLSIAAVMAQVKLSEEQAQPETFEVRGHESRGAQHAQTSGATQHNAALEIDFTESAATAIWTLDNPPVARRSSKGWQAAVLLAVLLLCVQGIHHFRSELAGQAVVGPWLQQAYGFLGAPIARQWDIDQYQILDWVATADPDVRERGSLKITARIHNRGPQAQPHPRIHLQLKDRWDETVGSRIFTPAEYLGSATTTSMAAGEIAQAQLEIVDPGSDAYGFELDVCVEDEAGALTCGNDAVFL